MKRVMPAIALALVALAGATFAGPGPFLRDAPGQATAPARIGDGASCRATFRVLERKTPFVTGQALGTAPEDLVLEVEKTDGRGGLCDRIRGAGEIRMEAVERQLPGFRAGPGDRISGTVIYGEVSRGPGLVDGYRHLLVIENTPDGRSGVFQGLSIRP